MTLARGVAGAGGNIVPPVPTSLTITRRGSIAAGSNPEFVGAWSDSFGSITKNAGRSYTAEFFKASDNTSVGTYTFTTSTFTTGATPVNLGITLVKGTSYYYKIRSTDIRSGLTGGFSTSSPSLTALTLPSTTGAFSSVTGGIQTASAVWAAPTDNGGETLSYDWTLRLSSNSSLVTNGSTTTTSVSINISAGTYFFEVYPKNSLGTGPGRASGNFTVSAAPFFPFFPSFGPFFPFFPSFGPSFGPSFPRFFY
jgi:hypothetical protein